MPESPSDLHPGDRCGGYELLAFIGRGGMAQVWSAREARTGETVAVKTLLPGYADNAVLQERLMREGRSQQALRHPNILRAHGTFEWRGTNFVVMDLVDGESLERYLLRRRLMPAPEVRGIAQAVLSALAHAHSSSIVHRDVKPSNILLSRQGRVLLSDFGIALLQNATRLTRAGSMGTPSYMSPEQILGRDIGPLSDVYSLGCVLYELLAGMPPFHAEGPEANDIVRNAHRFTAPEPLSPKNPSIPPALEVAVLRSLEKRPEARFASCAEFAAALGLSIQPADVVGRAFAAEAGGPDFMPASFTPPIGVPPRQTGRIATGPGVTVARPSGPAPARPSGPAPARSSAPTPVRRSAPPKNTTAVPRKKARAGAMAIVLSVVAAAVVLWIVIRPDSHAPVAPPPEQASAPQAPSVPASVPKRAAASPPAANFEKQFRKAIAEVQKESTSAAPPAPVANGPGLDAPPAPLRAPPGYSAPASGVLQWAGAKAGRVVIDGTRASNGTLSGDPLPGGPVELWLQDDSGALVRLPSLADGYKKLVFDTNAEHERILWKTIPSGLSTATGPTK